MAFLIIPSLGSCKEFLYLLNNLFFAKLKKILPLFSYIFHPLFIPIYATLFYLFSNYSHTINKEKLIVFIEVVVVTMVLPIVLFFLLQSLGKISSIMAPKISERKLPLIIQCFLIIILVKKGITIEFYPELHFFFLGGLMSTLICLSLLFAHFKASLHMIGISALTCFVVGLSIHFQYENPIWIGILCCTIGLVAFSRLEMKAHTPKELITGLLIGSFPQIILMLLWL